MRLIRSLVIGSLGAAAFKYAKKWLAEHPDALSDAARVAGIDTDAKSTRRNG